MSNAGSHARKAILRTPFIFDLRRAFNYTLWDNGFKIYGSYAQTISTYAQYHNVQLEFDFMNSYKASVVNSGIRRGYYNLSLYGSGYLQQNATLQSSYPLEWVKYCVMVPLAREMPKFWYVVYPFGPYIWLMLILGIFYVGLLLRYLEYFSGGSNRSILHCLLHSVAILTYGPNLSINLNNRPVRAYLFYALLFALGFILSAYHTTHMTAYCMKPIFGPKLNTLADLKKSTIQIFISADVLDELINNFSININPLKDHIKEIDWEVFQETLEHSFDTFNNSVAFVVTEEKWKFIMKQQRLLKQPFFHLSQVCFGGGFTVFPLHPNPQLADSLHRHILAVQQAGLWDFWNEEAFDIAVFAKKAKILLDTYPVLPLDLQFFRIGWIVLAVGLLASSCTMFFECYLGKKKRL